MNDKPQAEINTVLVAVTPDTNLSTNAIALEGAVVSRGNGIGATSETYLMDCIVGMKHYPDKYFDLAVVDPPYGILSNMGDRLDKYGTNHKKWDASIPEMEYFTELIRVSKNQIVWGGNYFPALWQLGCKCFIFWYKHQPVTNWAAGEFAWTSFDKPAKCFDYMCYGGVNQDKDRFHPTQKPIKLYDFCFKEFSEPGQKILDTHLGSGSSRIAAHRAGLNFVGFEIDEEYYEKQELRFKNYSSQLNLFNK